MRIISIGILNIIGILLIVSLLVHGAYKINKYNRQHEACEWLARDIHSMWKYRHCMEGKPYYPEHAPPEEKAWIKNVKESE